MPGRLSSHSTTVIVTARDEASRIGATLDALRDALPRARLLVADDASRDGTAEVARSRGAEVLRQARRKGKGGAASAAAALAGRTARAGDAVLFCDADLGGSARELGRLVEVVRRGEADLAIARFKRKQGGGFGLAQGAARRLLKRQTGIEFDAPISGQRAVRAGALELLLPFSGGFGMEVGMTFDAVRAGLRLREVELDLDHRVTGRSLGGFLHRGVQLLHFCRALAAPGRLGALLRPLPRRSAGSGRP